MSDKRKRLTVIVTRAGVAAALGALLLVRVPEEKSLQRVTAALPSPGIEHTHLTLSVPDGGTTPGRTDSREVSRAQKEAAEAAPPPIAASAAGGPARFLLRDGGAVAYFTDRGLAMSLAKAASRDRKPDGEPELPIEGWGLLWSIDGATPVEPRAEGELPGRVNSFIGSDPARWKSEQASFSRIVYDEVRTGMDLTVESRRHGVKYTITLAAGSYTGPIRLRYEGAEELRIVDGGAALEIQTGAGVVREDGLVCYQPDPDGAHRLLACRYVSAVKDAGDLTWSYAVELDGVDSARPVVIDPTITWSSYLGGAGYGASGGAITVDNAGNVYIVGTAYSGFPLVGGFDSSASDRDAVVTKFSPDGSTLIWSSYLGGNGGYGDHGADVAVDDAGNVYVTGMMSSADFPLVGGLGNTYAGYGVRAYVAKISASGATLVWSSQLGGNGGRSPASLGAAIALDGDANVYVTGEFYAGAGGFGTPGSFDETENGWRDAFVVKIAADGASLVWGGCLGAALGVLGGDDIAVDGSRNVYVGGYIERGALPGTAGGFDPSAGGGLDGFIAKINAAGSTLMWASYIGGSGHDNVHGCVVDGAGNLYVCGYTMSTDFPIAGGFDSTLGGVRDAFVMKVAASGAALLWSSYLGGSGSEYAYDLALNGSGRLYVTGNTESVDFPTLDATDGVHGGGADGFVSRISASGASLEFSTFLGGSDYDNSISIALSSVDTITVGGYTMSADFQTTPGVFQPAFGGGSYSLFVAQYIENVPPTVSAPQPADGAILATLTPELSAAVAAPETGHAVVAEFSIDGGPFVAVPSVTTSGTGTFVVPPLAEGTHTWSVRARDAQGKTSAILGPFTLVVDITPPQAGVIRDGAGRDLAVQASTTRIDANWSGFADPVTGVTEYEWSIGSGPGAGDVQPFTSVGLATDASTSAATPDLSLTPGTTYFVTVRATNAAGLSTTVSSDGVLVETTDSVPPASPATLRVYPGHQTLSLEWDRSPSADVSHYLLWWKASAAPWTDAGVVDGLALSTTLSGLTDGVTYDVRLKAVDGKGNESLPLDGIGMPCAVKIDGGGQYASLQEALSAALPGQTILVGAGVHSGDFIIPGAVSLAGMSPRHTRIVGTGGSVLTLLGVRGVDGPAVISNLTLETGTLGIDAGSADVRLEHLVLHHMSAYGITAAFGGRLEVVNCTVMSNGLDGIASFAETTIRNCITGMNGGFGIYAPVGSSVTYSNSYGNLVAAFASGASGAGNISEPAVFTDEAASDYTEQPLSPTIDAGDPADDASAEPVPNGERINIGAFGNTPWAGGAPVPSEKVPYNRGRCGLLGLEALIAMGLLRRLRRC